MLRLSLWKCILCNFQVLLYNTLVGVIVSFSSITSSCTSLWCAIFLSLYYMWKIFSMLLPKTNEILLMLGLLFMIKNYSICNNFFLVYIYLLFHYLKREVRFPLINDLYLPWNFFYLRYQSISYIHIFVYTESCHNLPFVIIVNIQ